MKTSRWIIALSLSLVAWQFPGRVSAADPSKTDIVSIHVPPAAKSKTKTTTAPAARPMLRVSLLLPQGDQMALEAVMRQARIACKEAKKRAASVGISAAVETPFENLNYILTTVVIGEFRHIRLIAADRQAMITVPDLLSGAGSDLSVPGRKLLQPIRISVWPKGKTRKVEIFQVIDLGVTTDPKTLGKALVALAKAAGRDRPVVLVKPHPQVSWKNVVEACAQASEAGFKKIYLGVPDVTQPDGLDKEPKLPPAGPKIPADWFKQTEMNHGGMIVPKMVNNKLKPGKTKIGMVKGAGSHIVYVVDRSGSMLETFDKVRHEVVLSITRLPESRDFHLIFITRKVPIENPPRKLVPADLKGKKQAVKFIGKITPEGQTNPLPAMKRAFDVLAAADKTKTGKAIYLFTDGEFPDNKKVLRLIAARNKDKSVVINTYLFTSDRLYPEAVKILKKIADDNRGIFRIVQVN